MGLMDLLEIIEKMNLIFSPIPSKKSTNILFFFPVVAQPTAVWSPLLHCYQTTRNIPTNKIPHFY